MEQLKVVTPFLKLFFWCGQTSYTLQTDKLGQQPHAANASLMMQLPNILWTSITLIINAILIYLVNFGVRRSTFDNSDAIITNIFITCQVLKVLSVFVQSVFYHRAISEATRILLGLETFFNGSLQHQIDYRRFGKQILMKGIFLAVIYLQSAIFLAFRNAQMDTFEPINGLIKIMQIRSITILLHIIFYVDLMRFHLVELNAVIERDGCGDQDIIQNNVVVVYRKSTKEIIMSNKYKNYKHMHYRLWNANQLINHYFGWCLTAVFLQTFIDCVYNSYWQYNVLNRRLNVIEVLREFILYAHIQ